MATGHVSPKKMLKKMSLKEVRLWAAFWEVDPWGQERGDLRAGLIASTVAEVNRSRKHKPTPYKPLDFMPYSLKDKNMKNKDVSARLRAALKGMGK